MNFVTLVGRLVNEPTIEENDNIKKTILTIAVTRSFRNADGVYETDLIPCVMWNGIASNVCDYCHKGDVVGIKGRLQMKDNNSEVIAEKVTFLSSKAENKEENKYE